MTAASMGGAVKALIETAGLGVPVYRDGAPESATLPDRYVTVHEGIAYGETQVGEVVVEQVQVDLWQTARGTAGARVVSLESYTLPEHIAGLFRGRDLQNHAPWQVYGLSASGRRWPPSGNLVRHTWTVSVTRSRTRKAA